MACKGFASGNTTKDAFAVRHFVEHGHQIALSQSFCRHECRRFVPSDPEERARFESRLKIIIRPMHSNPPIYGARITNATLANEDPLLGVGVRERAQG